ncbi:MAG: 5'/3'-nucleotidase SurE [Clostridia bacterium]|nr:5'/3'-nucleotidase SurE [Clostridia bacterium]
MKILLTNDDGIYAEGLSCLIDFAKTLGDVTVVAPLVQQSGKSQAIELHKPYEVKKTELDGAIKAYSVDSTPADCVRFAILGLKEKYDLVISGINRGFNIGDDIAYSGTVGAVYEASRQGVKAIAVSSDLPSFESAKSNIAKVFDFIMENSLLDKAEILNVNFPMEVKGMRITKQGYPMYEDDFVCVGDDLYEPRLHCMFRGTADLTIDTDCVMNGYISITPLKRGNTDIEAYNELKTANDNM